MDWFDNIKNTHFLMHLYNEIPELSNVEIERFDINYYGREIKIIFKIPKQVDDVPIKWKKQNFNAAIIEIDFWDVTNFAMSMDSYKKSNMNIIINDDGELVVDIQGGINASFVTEGGYIQNVNGYIWE